MLTTVPSASSKGTCRTDSPRIRVKSAAGSVPTAPLPAWNAANIA